MGPLLSMMRINYKLTKRTKKTIQKTKQITKNETISKELYNKPHQYSL